MWDTIILILSLILILIIIRRNRSEGYDTAITATNDALQSIAKIYADASGTVNFTNAQITGTATINRSNLMPPGAIIAYSGDVTKIPETWVLCDGQRGTPDLRGRFILGYNPENIMSDGSGNTVLLQKRLIGDKGGIEQHTLTVEELPSHKHCGSTSCMGINPRSDWATYTDMRSTHGWNCHDRGEANKICTADAGGGKPHNNMPPFYTLAYIMKL